MKISLITAMFNSAETLRDTMQSVLNQTYKDVEYIIVDGGSKDATIDIVKEFEPRFESRLRWVSERDEGIYDAMNKGIRMATGDVIGILNSDDFFAADDILEKVNAEFEAHDDIDGVYGDVIYVDNKDVTKIVRRYSSAKFDRRKIIYGMMPAHPSFYAKKSCFEKYGYYSLDYKIAADYDMFVRFVWGGNISIKYIPVDFVVMRTGGMSSSGMTARKIIMREHMASVRAHGVPSNFFLQSLRYFGKIIDLIKK